MTTHGTTIGDWVNAIELRTPYYLVIIDIEGQMSFCNSYFYNSFRAAYAINDRDDFFCLVHESDRQELSRTLSTCAFRDQAIHTELRVKYDHFRWVNWEISRIQKPENMSEKFLCLGSDIAGEEQHIKNRQSFEEHYQQNNGLFLSFMENTPCFSWIADEEDNLMFANRSLLNYFHLDESVFGKAISSIIPVSFAAALAEKYLIITFPIDAAALARMVGAVAIPKTIN